MRLGIALGFAAAMVATSVDARALGLVWKEGTPAPEIVSTRAVLTYDGGQRIQSVALDLEIRGTAEAVILGADTRPSVYGLSGDVIERVKALADANPSGEIEPVERPAAEVDRPRLLHLAKGAESATEIPEWLETQGLEASAGLGKWLANQRGYVAVAAANVDEGHVRLRISSRAKTEAVLPASVDPTGTFDLLLVSETPIQRKAPQGAKPEIDREHSGPRGNALLPKSAQEELGLLTPMTAVWVGQWDMKPPSAREVFTVADRRRADDQVTFAGPPFKNEPDTRPASQSVDAQAPAAPSAKAKLASGASNRKGQSIKSRRSRKKWPREASAGFAIMAVIAVGGIWWWMKRKEAA